MTTNEIALRDELRSFRAAHGIRTWSSMFLLLGHPVTLIWPIRHLRPIDASVAQRIRESMARMPDRRLALQPRPRTLRRSAA